jgi:hypothetical protein
MTRAQAIRKQLHEAEVLDAAADIVQQLRGLNEPVIDERLHILGYPDCDGRTLYMNGTGRNQS